MTEGGDYMGGGSKEGSVAPSLLETFSNMKLTSCPYPAGKIQN